MIPVLSALTTVYGTAGAAAILLQAKTMMHLHSSADVSLQWLAVNIGGDVLFLAYGLAIHSAVLMLSDAVGLISGGATFAVAVRYHHGGLS